MNVKVGSAIPNELKSIEIDVEKNIFRINGEDFGNGCEWFSILCEAADGFRICMHAGFDVTFASYSMKGEKLVTSDKCDQHTENPTPLVVMKDAVDKALQLCDHPNSEGQHPPIM